MLADKLVDVTYVDNGSGSFWCKVQSLAITGSVLWVAAADATVTRLDAASGQPKGSPVSVGAAPLALAPDRDGVWVASRTEQTLQRLR